MNSLPQWLSDFSAAVTAEYRVIRLLGQGGMASVLLAEELALKRLVAIKVLDPALMSDPAFRSRFSREGEAAASLEHPHIVPIYRVGEVIGIPYFAMQYVEGETLGDRLAREGKLSASETVRITREVAQALRVAHKRGIVHRDVKPQNILINGDDGRALVTDFGIARQASDDITSVRTRERLTSAGHSVGTPRYMSPEQVAGGTAVGPSSDLYSLGVVMYEMLAGAFPYEETPGRNLMLSHAVDPVVPLAARVPGIEPRLATIAERLLEKEPSRRFASADALIEALGDQTSRSAVHVAPTTAKRTRWLAIAAVAVVATAAALFLPGKRSAGAAEDPRRSLLVGYFDNTTRDPALEWLRVGGVELLARSLSRWDDLSVVETPRLLDLARRAKLGDDAGMSQEQVIQLARAAGAGTAGLGSILRTGTGQSSITLRLYDVASGELLTTESEESSADSLLPVAFSRLADKVFRIAGAPQAAIVDAEPPTQSIVAYREFIQGVRAAYQWQLDTAEARFAAAIAADPAFALAWVRRAENTFLNTGPTEAGLALVEAYADSALAHSSARPLKERLLIESLAALLHADFPKTRELAGRLIALDSTNAEAWRSLGMGYLADRFVVEKADGSLETGYDPTSALRAFRRSAALDSSNRQTLMFVSAVLGPASFEMPGQPLGRVWLSRSTPTWKVVSQFGAGAYYRMIMVAEDSFRFARIAEINRSLRPSDISRSRELAVSQLRTVARNWLLVAPEDYSAHLLNSRLAEIDGNFELALAEYNQSLTLGFKTEPLRPDWDRLLLVLRGRNDSAILAIADTLRRTLDADRPYLSEVPWYMGQLSAAAVYAGRANEGRSFDAERLAMRDRISPRASGALRTLTEAIAEVQARAWSGTMTAAEVASASERLHALHAALPDSIQARQRLSLFTPLGYPAALLGDTARVAKLRAALLPEFRSHYPGLDAIAAAVAGDRRKADQLVTRALADTAFPWPGSRYATGRAALMIGRADDALRSFYAVDSASFNLNVLDLDWLFAARAIRGRGDAYLARGDTARARQEFERFVSLWRDAEPPYASERDAAARALAQLRSQSDRKGVTIPGSSRP